MTEQDNSISIGELSRNLKAHIQEEGAGRAVIAEDIKTIKENHLAHMQESMASMETDVGWLKKYHWVIATASVGGLIGSLINLIAK